MTSIELNAIHTLWQKGYAIAICEPEQVGITALADLKTKQRICSLAVNLINLAQ